MNKKKTRKMWACNLPQGERIEWSHAMSGKSWRLVKDDPVEFEK